MMKPAGDDVILAAMPSARTILRVLLSIAAIFYLIFIWRTAFQLDHTLHFTLVDDAMVSMRYGRNLAQGNGLVWNPGQPAVEGFTNLGWTLVMAAVHLLPFSQANISLAIMLLGALMLLGEGMVVFEIAVTIQPAGRLAALAAAAAVLFYFPLVFWTLRGLEVGALSLLLSLALWLALRLARNSSSSQGTDSIWLAVALAAAIAVRLDAALPAALIVGYLASRSPRRAILPALAALLSLAAVLAFQKTYYGDLLPNTYYLKVAGVGAWERVRTGLLSLNDYALRDFSMPLFVSLGGLLLYKKLRTRESLLLLAIFAAQIGYSVWVGGDYAEELVDSANRFIAQGMPALIILFSLVLERAAEGATTGDGQTSRRGGLVAGSLVGIAAALVISGEPWFKWTYNNAPMLPTDIQRTAIGLHIKQYTDPAAVIAAHAAGQIPYYSERTTIDLLGKSDPVIAKGPPATGFAPGHNKWNYEYSLLELKPDVVADNFNKLKAFMQGQDLYVQLPNHLYVRRDSTLVDIKGLGSEYLR
jgi:hypothetical protein